jgi:signal transduction histidine kinase
VDIRRGIESTLRLLRHALQQGGVGVEATYEDGPLTLRGDQAALNQLFLNLIKNSAVALEGRQGTIRVAVRHEGAQIVVTVGDDGPGISPEARDRLFEPFFSTKEAGSGSGLGLAICRKIVTEHGGTIEASSPPGEGATFTIVLPAERGAAQNAT